MKIFVCTGTETPNTWTRNLVLPLRDMGHEVHLAQGIGLNESFYRLNARAWSFKWRRKLGLRLLEEVRRVHSSRGLDLFLIHLFPFQFDPSIFKAIEALGIPTVCFFPDNLQTRSVLDAFAPYFTLNWVPELGAVPMYKARRYNFIYLPMAANPALHRPHKNEESKDLVFIGTKTPYRRWLLGSLLGRGFPLEIYGPSWHERSAYYGLDDPGAETQRAYPKLSLLEQAVNILEMKRGGIKSLLAYGLRPKRMQKTIGEMGKEFEALVAGHASQSPLSNDEVLSLYGRSKVTLGINHYIHPSCRDLWNQTYSKLRDFEAPMSGACYLTQHTEELDRFYPEEGIIETYRSLDELCEKAKALSADKPLRDRMRRKAREYCIQYHTWQHRFERLFKRLGLA